MPYATEGLRRQDELRQGAAMAHCLSWEDPAGDPDDHRHCSGMTLPKCSCGWKGLPRATMEWYRGHDEWFESHLWALLLDSGEPEERELLAA